MVEQSKNEREKNATKLYKSEGKQKVNNCGKQYAIDRKQKDTK